ncbi:hypothetical protein PoB_001504900 [Plakobranchus ocellatus]|uniref:Uncharacterized protein n=1 Tax=Plakobranchus ocellatus TaxID=259542 RepID=A0AAV3YZR6_9GAST|nr:hypothetical protein PoB_001504900 [Plakobranchus ocellatus]
MKVGPRVEFTELDPKPELPALGVKFGSKAETKVTQSQTYQVGQYLEVFLYTENGACRPYRGIIQDCIYGEWEIRFMEKKGDAYVWPVKDDISLVPGSDISQILPPPTLIGRGKYMFIS